MNESDELRTAHNSFARPEPFVIEQSNSGSSEDTYHYVCLCLFVVHHRCQSAVAELDTGRICTVRQPGDRTRWFM